MDQRDIILAVMATSGGAVYTPVQIQKLLFLLDKKVPRHTGGPHFDFAPDAYGPFDSDVYFRLTELESEGLVEITPVRDARSRLYRLTPSGKAEGDTILNGLVPDLAKYIVTLSEWVRSLSFAKLVSAIYREFPGMKANSVFR